MLSGKCSLDMELPNPEPQPLPAQADPEAAVQKIPYEEEDDA